MTDTYVRNTIPRIIVRARQVSRDNSANPAKTKSAADCSDKNVTKDGPVSSIGAPSVRAMPRSQYMIDFVKISLRH